MFDSVQEYGMKIDKYYTRYQYDVYVYICVINVIYKFGSNLFSLHK